MEACSINRVVLLKDLNLLKGFSLYDCKYDYTEDKGDNWRMNTRASWYNEEFGKYRGNQKWFPAVAVLCYTAHQIYIYNLKDEDLWMTINVPEEEIEYLDLKQGTLHCGFRNGFKTSPRSQSPRWAEVFNPRNIPIFLRLDFPLRLGLSPDAAP